MLTTIKDIGDYVVKAAPILGAAISETNPIAGMVIELIARIFGANPADNNDIMNKMSSDPDAAIKLKQLEINHQDVLSNNQSEEYQASIQGRLGAYQREEKVIQLTGKPDYVLHILAFTVVFGFFFICALNYFTNLSDDHIVTMLIGYLSASFLSVVNYYFSQTYR